MTRKPFLALLASLAVPGLGQLYNGKLRKAVLAFGLGLAPAAIGAALPPAESFRNLVALFVAAIVVVVAVVADAVRDARASEEVVRQPYQRWYVYLGVLLVQWVVVGPALESFSGLGAVKSFKLSAGSMLPTLAIGDRLIADREAYAARRPQRGDIVVFKYPREESTYFVKRVLGLPGEQVAVIGDAVLVDGTPLEEPWGRRTDSGGALTKDFPASIVPDGSYFMLGDNRDNSFDSRHWGPVHESKIIGKARYLYWSGTKGRIGERLEQARPEPPQPAS